MSRSTGLFFARQFGAGASRRVTTATIWTVASYGAQQAIRFGSNLVLARLLFPEAFGIASLVSLVIVGLELISDVGIGPAIVQSKRGDDATFLATAWSIQVARGLLLTVVSLALAWPFSLFFSEPRLVPMLCVASLGLFVRGLTSIEVHSATRKVILGRLSALELTAQCAAVMTMIALAVTFRSPWALVAGALVGDLVRAGLSFPLLRSPRPRWCWNPEVISEVVAIGRWIILGTTVTYLAGQADKLVVAKLFTLSVLGVYTMAATIVTTITNLSRNIGARVAFPVLAEAARTDPALLKTKMQTLRIVWVIPTVIVLCAVSSFSDVLIQFLYPERYHEAGWMLALLGFGAIAAVINQSAGAVWPAIGRFRTVTILMTTQVLLLSVLMTSGAKLWGMKGFVVGVALADLALYPIQAGMLSKLGLWQPKFDVTVILVAGTVVFLAYHFKGMV